MKKQLFTECSLVIKLLGVFSLLVLIGCYNPKSKLGNEEYTEDEDDYDLPLEERAEEDDADAQFALGIEYDYGDRSEDLDEAIKWYTKAAEQGHVLAQNNLAFCYQRQQNYEEALKWYRKAAEQNHAEAENAIGFFYYKGYGVEQDFTEAVRWYRKSAVHGSKTGQYNLGCRYLEGVGVSEDRQEAVKWLRKSADQGHQKAIDKLAEIGE